MPKPLNIPPHLNEKETLEVIEKVVAKLAPTFVFGTYSLDDIKQEARAFCLEALHKYDASRPLPNFLRTVLKRKLINLWRNKFQRNDPPCKSCHAAAIKNKINTCSDAVAEGTLLCDRYAKWYDRNVIKRNIVRPIDLSIVAEMPLGDSPVDLQCEIDELTKLIDDKLSLADRLLLLKMRDGVTIDKMDKARLYEAVKAALGERCTLNEDI